MATNTDGREEIKPVAPTEQTKWRDPSLVGKYMVDPKTGLAGLFRSPDNGETWVLTDTVYGHVYNQDEVDNIWDNGAGHKVADEIKSATADLPNVRKQADEAVKFAESAIAASKVNSDAIVAQSSAVVEAKSAMDSATAEIQQLKANAASDVAQIEATIAEVQAGVNQAKSANESAVQAVQAELKSTSDAMDKVKKRLNEVGNSLDTYAKSAAEQGHDITLIKQKQGQFEADFASAQGNVNQIQVDIKGLRQNVKDNQGNIASLLTSADKLQASMTDAEKNISNLLLTASKYEQTFKDQDGRLSKVEQTAAEHTSELTDEKGNIDKVTQKADNLQLLLSDAQKNIQNIQLDAKGLHDTLTGQDNQLASLNVTLNNLDSKYSGITGDLQSKQTALSTEQQQTKDMLLRKADRSEVDSVKGTVNQVSAEQKTMADQISQKVSSAEYQTLRDKVNGMKIGGRNYILNSAKKVFYPVGQDNYDLCWNVSKEAFNINPDKNGQYKTHFSFDMQASSALPTARTWRIYWRASPWTSFGTITYPANTTNVQHYELKITTPATQPIADEIFIRFMKEDTGKSSYTITNSLLTIGDVFEDYSPNPDDTIATINKNTTAIDENSKLISLMAKQTDVDNIKGTAQQLSARLDVMAGEVKSKVDETRVNSIVDGKGYATTSTVQSLVDQKAGTINESITNLTSKVNGNNGGGINLLKATDFANIDIATLIKYWGNQFTIRDGVAIQVDGRTLKSGCDDATQIVQVEPDTDYTLSFEVHYSSIADGGHWDKIQTFLWEFQDAQCTKVTKNYQDHARSVVNTNKRKDNIYTIHTQPDCRAIKVIFRANPRVLFSFIKPKLERGSVATPWSPAPSDNATVTQLQSLTASIDGLQSRVTNYQNDTSSKYTQLSNLMQSKVNQGDLNSVRTQLAGAINERVQKGELLSQINLTAGNTLIQSNKLYLDASSVVITGTAFIPSAAIASLSADKIISGEINTDKISLGNGHVRLSSDDDHFYLRTEEGAINNPTTRFSFDSIDFMDNSHGPDVVQYSIGYDTSSADRHLRISAFDHFNSGGASATQGYTSMVDAISLNSSEINFAAGGNMHMQVVNGGVNIKPTLFLQNNTNNGTYAGFTRLDNSDTVEFNTGNNNGENFHVNSGARFMQYVYINGYARAQGWLTNSTLSKKTNIRKLDTQVALDKIRQDDQYLYEYKRNVAQGIYDPQASFIIDDVNDVSHYSVPREFIDQSGNYREPNVELAYLIAAFQAIDKQVQLQQAEIKELKEKLQHE